MTPRPFAIGCHVWTVRLVGWTCGRCGQVLRVWRDLGGRVHVDPMAAGTLGPCPYRPRRRFVTERDANGWPVSLGWVGDY